jgi:hypothetical protein
MFKFLNHWIAGYRGPISKDGHLHRATGKARGPSRNCRFRLSIENPPSYTTLNVDDSAARTLYIATLDTITPAGDSPLGTIAGLAPAAINFKWADVSSVNISDRWVGWFVTTQAVVGDPGVVSVYENGNLLNGIRRY